MSGQHAGGGPDSASPHERAQGLVLRRPARLAWLPIPLLALAIIVGRVAGLSESYRSETLTLVLSFIFYTVVSLGTLFLIGRSFLASGMPGLLLLECGVVLWSLAGTVGDAVSHGDANINVTIFNSGILLAGLCHLAGAIFSLRPQRPFRAPSLWLGAGCALALAALWLVTRAALANWLPVFFIPGQGGTLVRYCVLISAIAMFVLSSSLLLAGQRGARAPFTSWYALALLLLAVGLFGVMIQLSLGSVVNWLGRTAQWLGGLYLLLASVAALRESDLPLLPLENESRPDRYRYGVAIAIVLAAAALRLAFLSTLGARGLFLTFYPAVMLAALYGGLRAGLLAIVLSALFVNYSWMEPSGPFTMGSPADRLSLVVFVLGGLMVAWVSEAMHRARTRASAAETQALLAAERVATLEKLRESEERYHTLFTGMTEGFAIHELLTDESGKPLDYRFLDVNPAFERLTGLKRESVLGKTHNEVLPGDDPKWLQMFSQVVLTGQPVQLESYSPAVRRHHEVFAYCPAPMQFAVILMDVTERKRIEKELRKHREWLRVTLSSIGDAVIATDVAGSIAFMNAVAEELTGWTFPEASMKPATQVFNIINEYSRKEVESPVAKVLREGMVTGLANHTILVKKDGTEVPIDDSGAPIRDGDGNTRGVVLIFRDITERKKTEERLKQSNQTVKEILNSIQDDFYVLDRNWRFVYASKSFASKIFKEPKDFIGNSIWEMFPKHVGTDFEENFLAAMDKREVRRFEVGGKYTDAYYSMTVFPSSDGITVLGTDITQHRRAGEALRKAHDELELRVEERTAELRKASAYNRNLIEASIDPLVTIDQEGRISDANAATEKSTGYSRDELIGTDFSDYFTNPRKAQAGYRMVFDEGFVCDYPLEIRHRDGHITPVLYNASVYRDDAGTVIGVFAAARDVSERQKLEALLRQAQKMEALGTLSGGIAHDFNNILAAIIGFTELLEGHVAKASRDARHLDRIMEAAIRGRELVRQMLTFSRKAEQEKRPLPVNSIVEETVKLIRATTPSTISISVNASRESLILGDPTQIQQVLMNLCTNAAYAMREKGGSLDIELSDHSVSPSNGDPQEIKPGLYVKLIVRDSGIGMSADIMDKIFDPFFTTKKVGEGTGLGLSVVHGIVKQHDGHITVMSEPGKGSTFTVYFPQITGGPEADALRDGEIPTGCERILFVDDEEALVEIGEDILAELGYEVLSRMNGREALELFRLDPSRFDLVITDQTMPEMTGIELAGEVLALRPDMPIIMCTGFSYVVDADKARAAGIKAFAMKPLTKREIARTVRKVLDE